MDAGLEKGRQPPEWFLNEPVLPEPWQHWIMDAFWDLNTCRPSADYSASIPWDKIVQYAEFHNLDSESAIVLVDIVRMMDNAYQEWCESNRPKKDNRKAK